MVLNVEAKLPKAYHADCTRMFRIHDSAIVRAMYTPAKRLRVHEHLPISY